MKPPEIDPRVRRTRAALREALARLLSERGFEDITLLEIAEAADLNRATIYKHYADKVALLDSWIADDLRGRLSTAASTVQATCEAKLHAVVGAACECMRWIYSLGRPDDRLLRPIAEARVRALLQHTVEFAIDVRLARAVVKRDLAAAMASAAIYGAAVVWARGPGRGLDAHVAKTVDAVSTLIVAESKMPRITRPLDFD
jgi:AcrR family transcriptional regulator